MLPTQFARKQFLYLAVLQNLRLFHLNRKVKEMPDKRGRDIFSRLTPVTFHLIYHRKKFFQTYRVKKQRNRHLPNNDATWNAKRRQDFSCRRAGSAITFLGNHKVSAVRSRCICVLPNKKNSKITIIITLSLVKYFYMWYIINIGIEWSFVPSWWQWFF